MVQVPTVTRREPWTQSGPIAARMPEDEIEILEDRAAATIADPAALGLWGFATGTWVTGTVIAGMFPPSALTATIPVLLVFAGLAQFIAGSGRMGVFAAGNKVRTKDFHAGDVGYVPRAMGHHVENTGNNDLVFLEVFRSSYYSSISFSQWLSHLPPELVKAHFNFSDDTMKALSKHDAKVLGA